MNRCYYHSHFPDEEARAQRSDLSKVTLGAKIQTQAFWLQVLCSEPPLSTATLTLVAREVIQMVSDKIQQFSGITGYVRLV